MHIFLRFMLFFFFLFDRVSSAPTLPDRFFKSLSLSSSLDRKPKEFFELKPPLPSDRLTPSCTLHLLHHDFGHTVGSPPVSVPYSPPSDCPAPWNRVVLQLEVKCRGEQYDRIAAVWLGGSEILRTSTAEPTKSGVAWKVRKDITRYTSLLLFSNLTLSMMLENVVDDVFTGVYRVEVSLLYYSNARIRLPSTVAEPKMNRKLAFNSENIGKFSGSVTQETVEGISSFEAPADLIIPISDSGHEGFWFRIQNELDVHSKKIRIPQNTHRAVLEMYVSFHGDDEFWYSNPPDAYNMLNNLNTGRGHGSFREVYVAIDGNFVASEIPFPVIFTGGINPLFWQPVVGIGTFDLPSYDIELTPFLGLLLDGKYHDFQIGVGDGVSFWLVDANLHLWLDSRVEKVQASSVVYEFPILTIDRESKFNKMDGSFGIGAKRGTHVTGWVISGAGNLTTLMSREFKVKSSVKFSMNGTHKSVKHKLKAKTEMRVLSEMGGLLSRTKIKKEYPLSVITATLPGKDKDSYLIVTNVTHALKEKYAATGGYSSSVANKQDSGGWVVVRGHTVLTGAADTVQSLSYREGYSCYLRTVAANNGRLVGDASTSSCEAAE